MMSSPVGSKSQIIGLSEVTCKVKWLQYRDTVVEWKYISSRTKQRDMTDYTLVPDQSQLAVFYNLCDVIPKEVLRTDAREQECKHGVRGGVSSPGCVVLKSLKKETTVSFPPFHSSTSQLQRHHSSLSSSCLQVRSALWSYWSTSPTHRGICRTQREKAKEIGHARLSIGCGVGCCPLWFTTRERTINCRVRRPFLFLPVCSCRIRLIPCRRH